MAFVGDAANFVLNGIPEDIHQLFVVDVEPGDLVRASTALTGLGDTVQTVHLTLSACVATLEGRWDGEGATAFQVEIWEPLSDGFGVLQRESHHAAAQLAELASQAQLAHVQKVLALDQEIQRQLNLTAITWLVAPGAGKAISGVLGGLAANLGGELVSRVVAGIVQAIEDLVEKVLGACAELFSKVLGSIAGSAGDVLGAIKGFVGSIVSDGAAVADEAGATASRVAGGPEAATTYVFRGADWTATVSFSDRQVQSQLAQHGEDFGFRAANNASGRGDYIARLVDHMKSPATIRIEGTYRGVPAVHYIDPETGLDVATRANGDFWVAWQLSPDQIWNVLMRGSLR